MPSARDSLAGLVVDDHGSSNLCPPQALGGDFSILLRASSWLCHEGFIDSLWNHFLIPLTHVKQPHDAQSQFFQRKDSVGTTENHLSLSLLSTQKTVLPTLGPPSHQQCHTNKVLGTMSLEPRFNGENRHPMDCLLRISLEIKAQPDQRLGRAGGTPMFVRDSQLHQGCSLKGGHSPIY